MVDVGPFGRVVYNHWTGLVSCGKIWGKWFDGDLCATLHRCTIHVTATVGRTRQVVLDGGPCATLHCCTLHVVLKQLVEEGSYK